MEVHTTFALKEHAVQVGRAMVHERLAACAQVVPGITSIYFWEEMLRHEDEVLLVLKTTPETWPQLRDRLAEVHPYETPQILAHVIEHANFEYINWVRENTIK